MHQALYRKYRPATFDDVCGQKHITDILRYEAENNRLSHAYLFCGSRGTGKTTCAKILAKAVNCEAPVNGSPCLKCPTCRDIEAGLTTDVIEMDAASHNGVEDIRTICEEVRFSPAMLKKKVYIIDEVHMLSTGAFNALLKTVEEPPEHALFILATTELHKVPATIVSRCQRFSFNRIDMKVIADRLLYIAGCENIALEKEAALLIARQAQGGMRDAIGLLELCSSGGADVTAAKVADSLGISGYETAADTLDAVASGDMAHLFGIVDTVYSSAKDISVFWQELISYVRDMLVSKYTENSGEYLDLTDSETALLTETAAKFNLARLVYISKILDEAQLRIARSPQTKRAVAEMALLRLCHPELDSSPEALSARIAKIEDAVALGDFVTAAPQVKNVADREAKENTVSPAPAPLAEQAEEITKSTAGNAYKKVTDMSEIVGKMDGTDRSIAQFLMSTEAYVSEDKKHIILETDGFAATMLGTENSKNSVSNAFARARMTDGRATVEIKVRAPGEKRESAADDLSKFL